MIYLKREVCLYRVCIDDTSNTNVLETVSSTIFVGIIAADINLDYHYHGQTTVSVLDCFEDIASLKIVDCCVIIVFKYVSLAWFVSVPALFATHFKSFFF